MHHGDRFAAGAALANSWPDGRRYRVVLGVSLDPFAAEHRGEGRRDQAQVDPIWLWVST